MSALWDLINSMLRRKAEGVVFLKVVDKKAKSKYRLGKMPTLQRAFLAYRAYLR